MDYQYFPAKEELYVSSHFQVAFDTICASSWSVLRFRLEALANLQIEQRGPILNRLKREADQN